jgi:hypothetical protein
MAILREQEHRIYKRDGVTLPQKPAWFHALAEFPMNVAGFGIGAIAAALPAKLVEGLHMRTLAALAGAGDFPLAPDWNYALEGARSLYARLADAGSEPAIWVLMSHPPVTTEVSTLNFALTQRAFEAVSFIRGRPTKAKMLVAIDPFAMDATPMWQEGVYPGLMTAMHLALDRTPSLRGPAQKMLLGAARPERLAWRLVRELRGGGDVVMILGGGIELNARIMYPSREFLSRWRKASDKRGASVRKAQREALAMLAAGEPSAAETGTLNEAAEAALRLLGRELGFDEKRVSADLDDFRDEFGRKNPYRRRLFRIVASRVVKGGRPVLTLPISHGSDGKTQIRLGEAAALTSEGGGLSIRMWENGRLESSGRSAEDFARRWIGAHFD